jgi:multicomponent Na+:H+ antiporter subunit G
MTNIIIGVLSTVGALAILFASIGILRMPDFYLRLSVTVKAATMGVGLFLICAAIIFPDVSVTTKAMATVLFLVLTAPVGAHMIARTAYHSKIAMWKDTVIDEYEKNVEQESIDQENLNKGHIENVENVENINQKEQGH